MIKQQGEVCLGLYLLEKGTAKEVVRARKSGVEATVRLLQPGSVYGLVPVVDGNECTSSLVAIQPSEFLFIPRDHFIGSIEHHPQIYKDTLLHLCYETRQGHQWVAELL